MNNTSRFSLVNLGFGASNIAQAIALHRQGLMDWANHALFMDLRGRVDDNQVDFVVRTNSIKPSDNSPFVNEIFNTEYTDKIFSKSDIEHQAFYKEYRQTNYAYPELPLIEQIYGVFYEQEVRSQEIGEVLIQPKQTSTHQVTDNTTLVN
ncbi:SidA/IucD/PvdA family monooxygenase [Pseudoalteromonas sp. HM-SA03]|uniref:SidA/IucD/PvdA family monooxygenase n=1 Tax=Pseudoalteromonas sp. HM-SA03 TaxID=2029678 RepID=UPI0020D05532|nr:SidA/IucD/PvdA family monooxygenase [Pseudoalteromonas sp. HM-SA03]